ncbi:MAG: sulfotransferase [Gemmatimonadota bacterium]
MSHSIADTQIERAFIVASPRSGTTWLQLLLAQHPAVATAQETHLFDRYLGPLERAWRGELSNPTPRRVGLCNALSEDEFYALCRTFATRVLDNILASKRGARVVVEKSPGHVRYWKLILRLFPDAHFVHIVRDPRGVVASMQNAGRSWGSRWAPTNAYGCARRWREAVEEGRRIAAEAPCYHELRYESLLADGERCLAELFGFLGIEADPEFYRAALEACAIGNLQAASERVASPWKLAREPGGFYRKGEAESWREELSRKDLRAVEYVTRALMAELGYEPALERTRGKPLSLAARETVRPARDRLASALHRVVRRLSSDGRS